MTQPIAPDRLRRLLDQAVQPVTPGVGTFDRICRGARRRRAVHQAGLALLTVVMMAAGSFAAVTLTSGSPVTAAIASTPVSTAGADPSAGTAPTASAISAADPRSALGTGKSTAYDVATTTDGRIAIPRFYGIGELQATVPTGLGPAEIVLAGGAGTLVTTTFVLEVRTVQFGVLSTRFSARSIRSMPPSGPVIVGSAGTATDGEVFVLVDKSCCAQYWTVFRLVGGQLTQATVAGQPVQLAVGSSGTSNYGFSCDENSRSLVSYQVQDENPSTFLITSTAYQWSGAALSLVSRRQATSSVATSGAATLARASVSCGDLPQYAA